MEHRLSFGKGGMKKVTDYPLHIQQQGVARFLDDDLERVETLVKVFHDEGRTPEPEILTDRVSMGVAAYCRIIELEAQLADAETK